MPFAYVAASLAILWWVASGDPARFAVAGFMVWFHALLALVAVKQ